MRAWRLVCQLGIMGGLVAAAIHCGTDNGSEFGDPANTAACNAAYAGKCGLACTDDNGCAEGLYCGPSKVCTADCASSVACENAGQCTVRGQCVTGQGFGGGGTDDGGLVVNPRSDGGVCANVDVQLDKTVPKVLFLLDQSSSMLQFKFNSTADSNQCANGCRWTVLKESLIGPDAGPGGLVKELEGEAELGVAMYSSTDSTTGEQYDDSYLDPPTEQACPRFNGKKFTKLAFSTNAFATIDGQLRPAKVDDDTPTGPAIRTVVGLNANGEPTDPNGLAKLAASGPKVIILVTDGEPGECLGNYSTNYASDEGRQQTVKAVQDAFKQNIRTFVIAIGSGSAAANAHFSQVANAGQGKPLNGDAGAILPANKDQLTAALRNIVLGARTCVFDLNGSVTPGKESLGTVKVNDAVQTFGAGWRLNSPTQIELLGDACTTVKTSNDARVSAQFPCDAFVIGNLPK